MSKRIFLRGLAIFIKKYRRQSGTGFEDAGDVTGPLPLNLFSSRISKRKFQRLAGQFWKSDQPECDIPSYTFLLRGGVQQECQMCRLHLHHLLISVWPEGWIWHRGRPEGYWRFDCGTAWHGAGRFVIIVRYVWNYYLGTEYRYVNQNNSIPVYGISVIQYSLI